MGTAWSMARGDGQGQGQGQVKAGSSMLNAIEDIQRLTPESMHQEFERMLAQTRQRLKEVVSNPCLDVSLRLQLCLKQNRERSCNCFQAMQTYQACVAQATRDRIDELAKMSPALQELMPTPTPAPTPKPLLQTSDGLGRRTRIWWKPWTWLR